MANLDLDAIDKRWLNPCALHDYGMPEYGCACPEGDPRPIISALVAEVARLRTKLTEAYMRASA